MGMSVPVILLTLSVLAFFMEAFVPSGGIITVVGLACVIAAIAVAFNRSGTQTGVIFLGISILLVPASLIAAFMLLPRTPLGKRLTLRSAQHPETGYVAQDLREEQLVGETGVAISMLRPSGEARIGDRRYDVVTQGEMIEKGTPVEVREVSGNRIVVRQVRSDSKPS